MKKPQPKAEMIIKESELNPLWVRVYFASNDAREFVDTVMDEYGTEIIRFSDSVNFIISPLYNPEEVKAYLRSYLTSANEEN